MARYPKPITERPIDRFVCEKKHTALIFLDTMTAVGTVDATAFWIMFTFAMVHCYIPVCTEHLLFTVIYIEFPRIVMSTNYDVTNFYHCFTGTVHRDGYVENKEVSFGRPCNEILSNYTIFIWNCLDRQYRHYLYSKLF